MYRTVASLFLVLLILAACGDGDGDTDATDTSSDVDVSRAAGTLGDPNLTLVVNELADGFGQLGRSADRALQGLAEGDAVCDDVAGPRANPEVSQVEVEIIRMIDGCLQLDYDVANFRTLVADIRRLRSQDDALAASPLLLEYRLNSQIESQWPIEAIEALDMLGQPAAPTGRGVTIAVIDSGIDVTHPALEGVSVRRAPDSGVGDYTATGHGTIAAAVMVSPIAPQPAA